MNNAISAFMDLGAIMNTNIQAMSENINSLGDFGLSIGNVSSIGTGIAVGSSVGAPYGAAAGLLVGTGFLAGEIAYDAGVWMRNETGRQIHNFQKALNHGWYPRR